MRVACPQCGRGYEVSIEHVGRQVRCSCGATFECSPVLPTPPPPLPVVKPSTEVPPWLQPPQPRRESKRLIAWIAAGSIAAICLLAVIVAAMLRPRPPAAQPQTAAHVVPPGDLPLVNFKDDAKEREQAAKRLLAARLETLIKTTPRTIATEVRANTIAAEKKHKGRLIYLRGNVAAVMRNNEGRPMIVFKTDSPFMVRVFLAPDHAEDAADLLPGQATALLTEFGAVAGDIIDLGPGIVCDPELQQLLEQGE